MDEGISATHSVSLICRPPFVPFVCWFFSQHALSLSSILEHILAFDVQNSLSVLSLRGQGGTTYGSTEMTIKISYLDNICCHFGIETEDFTLSGM